MARWNVYLDGEFYRNFSNKSWAIFEATNHLRESRKSNPEAVRWVGSVHRDHEAMLLNGSNVAVATAQIEEM